MKITVLDRNTLGEDLDISVITEMGNVTVFERTPPEKVSENIGDSDVIILNKVKLNSDNLSDAKNLKLICVAATGFDNIDVEYCKNHGIAVANVCGYSTDSVAQLTVSLALSLIMHLEKYHKHVTSGEYTKSGVQNHLKPTFHELSSMCWGIVGMGNIGKKVSEVAKAFGMKVLYFKKTPVDDEACVTLEEVMKKSDIISVHLPLSEETKGIINESMISQMKKSAVLVNVARGAVIDEKAVTDAIKSGSIGGFATDVYSVEPLTEDSPFNEILHNENTIFTPHMAWGSYESRMRCISEIRKNIEAFFRGEIRNRVDL